MNVPENPIHLSELPPHLGVPGPVLVPRVVHPEEVPDEDVPLLLARRPVQEVVQVPEVADKFPKITRLRL